MAPRKLVETLLLEAIQRDLFTKEGYARFEQQVTRHLTEHRRVRRPHQHRWEQTEAEEENRRGISRSAIMGRGFA